MPNINIPLEPSLLQLVNIAAERCGMRQKVWVVETLKAAVKDEVLEPLGTRKEEALVVPEIVPEKLGPCPLCGAQTIGWTDLQRKCTGCGRILVREFPAEVDADPKSKGRKLTAEEFMALSNSDQMRAKREGRF